MKEKLIFIEILCKDLMKNAKIHVKNEEDYEKTWKKYKNGELSNYPYNPNFMSKDHGKTALKRKITYLRQEFLNLERMLDSDD